MKLERKLTHVSNPKITRSASETALGDFAYNVIDQQFQYILDQEQGVIADQDPEYLHQMRVGLRRLQAAVTVFRPIVAPGLDFAMGKRVLKRLGTLRDLDVQLQDIDVKKQQTQTPGTHKALTHLQRDLTPKRKRAFRQVYKTLTQKPVYQTFKRQTQRWLKHPEYEAIAQLSIHDCAPELLSPIVSRLLLHPAWLLPETAMTHEPAFHDLRKLCKQVRYQAEFFIPLYPLAFKTWVKEIKSIQSGLGEIQDAFVFRQFIQQYQPGHLTEKMQTAIAWDHCSIIQDWELLRERYMTPAYRRQLHELIVNPCRA